MKICGCGVCTASRTWTWVTLVSSIFASDAPGLGETELILTGALTLAARGLPYSFHPSIKIQSATARKIRHQTRSAVVFMIKLPLGGKCSKLTVFFYKMTLRNRLEKFTFSWKQSDDFVWLVLFLFLETMEQTDNSRDSTQ